MAWGAQLPSPIRQAGAAQALGAPRVTGQRSQGVGKPPGAAKAKASGPPRGGQKQGGGQKAQHGQQPHPEPTVFNPAVHGAYSGRELSHIATSEESNYLRPQREALQAQGKEIQGTEQTVANRYGNVAKQGEATVAGLQGNAEASAKTYENQVAQNALKATQGVETAGQDALTRNAGYLDPQVKAAMEAGQARVGATGAAQNSLATNLGQNEVNFMGNLRAVAAQRATEGQANIASTYGKQQAGVQTKEHELATKLPELARTRAGQLGEKQFAEQGVKAKLASEGIKLRQGQEKIGQGNRKLGLEGAKVKQTGEKLGLEGRRVAADEWYKHEDARIKGLSAEDKAKYDEGKAKYERYKETHGGKAPNPKEGRKYMAQITTAQTVAEKAGVHRGLKAGEVNAAYKAAREALAKAGASNDVTNAAIEIAVQGRLSKGNQSIAQSYGLEPSMRAEWFR